MSKFPNQTEKNAKSVEEATALALDELGVSENEAIIEVLDEGSKGFLGLGSKDARVRVTVKEPSVFAAKKFLGDIFRAMNMEVDIHTDMTGESLNINLEGDDMGIIIGKRGDTLDALQYLTSLIVNHESKDYVKVALDTENYREKRTESLLSLSNRLADKVAKSGRKYTLEPMNPYERRIIHANLQSNAAVTTYSVGDEPYRKVVIAPKNSKPYYRKTYHKNNGYNSNYKSDLIKSDEF
ncbi:MAG: protein jag [Clostridia bacterium]|nr:protein jag [Clostridia bacterium]